MESILHSIIGSVAAILIMEVLRSFALPAAVNALAWLPVDLSLATFLIIYGILLVAGVIIGLVGSALAMRRYLSV